MTAQETFGHEPTVIDKGCCGGCDRCGDRQEREVCARCTRLIPTSPGSWPQDYVDWPCTSAIVLGLTPRDEPRLCLATFREESMRETVCCEETGRGHGTGSRHTGHDSSGNYYAWLDGDEGAGWDPSDGVPFQ